MLENYYHGWVSRTWLLIPLAGCTFAQLPGRQEYECKQTIKMASSCDNAEVILSLLLAYQRLQQKIKCLWTHSWLARREERSVYHILLPELSMEDHFVWNTKVVLGPRDDIYPSPTPIAIFLLQDTTSWVKKGYVFNDAFWEQNVNNPIHGCRRLTCWSSWCRWISS